MPDLLLEFLSEEIPARMQARAADDLKKMITDRLVEAGLTYEGAKAFATPRRLALSVHGVPARQPDVREEKKGPRVGAPDNAIAGFLKSAGLKSIKEAKVQPDKKGDFYVALIERKGRPAIDVIKDVLHATIATFPWPKSMRWGSQSATPGSLTWVRPLHSILATFGPETEEPAIVPLDIGGIKASNETRGHRFMAPKPFTVRRFDDYVASLQKAKVVLDAARRAEIIAADAKNLAFAQGHELVEDEGLLTETAGLVEWPVALTGTFDQAFLAIPDEVIRATIRNNQKCFVLRDPQTAKLVNKFILVANEEATDGGKAIIAGNERVIRARLSDAKFFYDTDLKTWKERSLEDRLKAFDEIVFHAKLGTLWRKIERVEILAADVIAPLIGADKRKVRRAAMVCKADLLTEMVGEFPELQGLIGRYYATKTGEEESVARACEDHYKPKGPSDQVPTDLVSIAVAIADKIDTLIGFWIINERPTGSKDPYGLRRAALGVIRILLQNEIRLPLMKVFIPAHISVRDEIEHMKLDRLAHDLIKLRNEGLLKVRTDRVLREAEKKAFPAKYSQKEIDEAFEEIFDLRLFFDERLENQLREQGARHDLADAVFEVGNEDDLLLLVRRVEALGKFLDTDDGKNLLAGVKRASNIIRIEEKKDKRDFTGSADAKLYQLPEEKALAEAVSAAKKEAGAAVGKEDFAAAMRAMAKLRPKVDDFFDKVTVNVDDAALRENRLRLLNEIRAATRAVADFSRIEG